MWLVEVSIAWGWHAAGQLREVGVTPATLYAPSADTEQVLRFLDDVAPLVDAANAT